MMLILIVAGSVAHEVMTASKSGSAGDDCGSLEVIPLNVEVLTHRIPLPADLPPTNSVEGYRSLGDR